ncbi:hypothetical protein [Paractinoplanes atraurantiacus]|uniref:Uncharacterized protein n=1 Tax=Paractinoplanes atraurantiacus TaxID=1036182 RepID=A0A285IYM8_9ACTN|nr:hypothetical protein [Actinoplanes atraurantiacus]SNY52923.1 hypothetical protein SAMN05421748_113134 [Actinoplanes atraurantiacus]
MTSFGVCPNCGQDDIIRIPSDRFSGQAVSGVAVSALRLVLFARLICLTCGFVREWVDDRKDLDLLRKKFGRQQ